MLNDEAEFVRKEQKVFKDTNISLQDVVDVLVDAEGGIAWYTNYREE